MAQEAPPGWHSDPHQPGYQRYWDGTRWTEHTRPDAPPPPGGAGAPPPPGGQPPQPHQPQHPQQPQPPYPQQFAQPHSQYSQPQYAAAPPQSSGMSTALKVLFGVLIGMVLLMVGCVAVVARAGNELGERLEEAQAGRTQAELDVERAAAITECGVGDFGLGEATVTLTNPLDEEKGYIGIEVNFLSGGVVVGSGRAVFENLEPGQDAIGQATAFDLVDGITDVTCEVADTVVF